MTNIGHSVLPLESNADKEQKMLEITKAIPGYENYLVTTWGRVYNTETGQFLKPYSHYKGYLRVDLFNADGKRHFKVHRLVANAFIPNPDGKPQVNHKDGNKHNNSITNLEWVTDTENKRKAVELRTQKEM